jgi:hypothetical protein
MQGALDNWPKHFLYLSPTKIDSIFYQIDQGSLRSIAKKLTIDLKVVKAEVSSAARPDTIYSRLKVVLSYLERQSLIGSIDQPGSYFAGSLLMRWGPYIGWRETPEQSKLVYFGGATKETILGLGGSIEHVFGNIGSSVSDSHSSSPSMLRALLKDLGLRLHGEISEEYREEDEDEALTAVEVASSGMEGPLQPVEFVAKRLLWGDAKSWWGLRGERTLLGSPIYAALDD